MCVCVCARVRARETRRRRWGGYALCRPLRSLLTRFANRSLPSPLLLLILILVLLRFLFLAIFFDFLFLEGRERRLRNLSTGLGGHSWKRGRYLEFVEFSSGMFPF